jgi:hypothetical protein
MLGPHPNSSLYNAHCPFSLGWRDWLTHTELSAEFINGADF